jgi:hypothetical protein
VWRHCDGKHDVVELAQLAGVSEGLVVGALHELREKDLLDAEPELMQSTIPGISRREAIGRAARYGAAAAAGSMIVSATAATPAMASSGEEIVGGCRKTGSTPAEETCCKCEDGTCKSALTKAQCQSRCPAEGHKFAEDWKEGWECIG